LTEENLNIEHSITINAAPERVWLFLTEPEYVAQWLGCMRYEKRIDHVFYMQQDETRRNNDDIEGATHCRILALDEAARFAFSWFQPGTPETEVSITLEKRDDNTLVTLTHTGWDQFDAAAIREIRDALEGGWKSFVLPNLKRVAESGN